ncbi:hypothetical protein CHLRE_06g299250v5 [Chlamydomonas reinhardtii]|uniref:Uncharacterized protein n=1 Tax=Chlamydomonas reinhardtii TaxID=3055 RepID=A0A2K3DQT8_CHLRE|nr:uncharacterized protein CHLRE_06g299250v5 [Chlamydomonas reinhardtii]PNW82911.1 hypothetical protein CHLRE_06g299250v5 [Chlamydomonas reinhardtii]
MLAARANRAGGGRGTRRASEHATKVPLSKKCKLDIKRKHLRGCQSLRGSLHADSYAVNLQLQIDGRNLPEVYKCTIKKHVNNKTSCVSYRLQGTGIYNHLRGLYMRGFAGGEEGVVLLVASTEAAPDLAYEDLGSDGEDDGTMAGAALAIARAGMAAADSDSQQQARRPQRPRRQQKKRRRDDTDDEEDDEEAAARLAQEEEDEEEEQGTVGTSGRGRAVAMAAGRGRGGSYSAQRRSKHQRLQSHPVHLDSLSPGSPDAADGADGGEGNPHGHHHAGAAAVPVHIHSDLHPHSLAAAARLVPHAHMAGNSSASAAAAGLGGGGMVQAFAEPLDAFGRGGVDGDVGQAAGLEAMAGPFDDVAIGVGLGVGLGGLSGLADGGGLLGGMPVGVGAGGGVPGGLLAMGHQAGGSGGGAGPVQVQVPVAAGTVAVADMHPNLLGPGPQHAGIPGVAHADEGFGGGPHHQHQQPHHHHQQEQHAPPMLGPLSPQLPPLSLSPFSPRLNALLGVGPNRGGAHQHAQQTVNAFGAPLDFDQGWPGARQLNYVDNPWE